MNEKKLTRYVECAWACVVRDEPAWPGDHMTEVVWTREEAEANRARGYFVYSLFALEAAEASS